MCVLVLLCVKLSVRVVSKPKAMTLFGPAATSSLSSTSWLPSSSSSIVPILVVAAKFDAKLTRKLFHF